MASKIDMSLEDIIKTTKKVPRGGSGRGRGNLRGGGRTRGGIGRGRAASNNRSPPYRRGNVDGRWAHDMYQNGRGGGIIRSAPISTGPTKLLISNLDFGVSDSDIHELFAEFGTLRNAAVHYDRSGRSLGTAHVMFDRRADALKALKQYNGVHLDGRPMNISINNEGGSVIQRQGATRGSFRQERPLKRLNQSSRPINQSRGRGGGRGGRGARGGRGSGRGFGGGSRGGKVKVPTLEELDAELDAYVNEVNK